MTGPPKGFSEKEYYTEYCLECKRFFDSRSGCEKDIRYDERNKMMGRFVFSLIIISLVVFVLYLVYSVGP